MGAVVLILIMAWRSAVDSDYHSTITGAVVPILIMAIFIKDISPKCTMKTIEKLYERSFA